MSSFWDLDKAGQEKLFGSATRAAISAAHAGGQRTLHATTDGKLYYYYPDGSRRYKSNGQPVPPGKVR